LDSIYLVDLINIVRGLLIYMTLQFKINSDD